MATGDYIIPGAQAVTETLSRVGGVIAGCGQAGLAVLNGITSGQMPSVAEVTALIQQGAALGVTGPTGVSRINGLQSLAAANGQQLTAGSGANALSTINSNLGRGLPTEVGVSNAHVFGGADTNVSGHYIDIVGRAANGNYIVADPNQPAALSGGFVQYSPTQIMQANPFGTLTPTSIPNPFNSATAFTSEAISQGIQGAAGGIGTAIANSLGVKNVNDFAWRAVLILGGMILMVIGLLVFFSHQEGSAVTVVSQQAGTAAKAAATAAAA